MKVVYESIRRILKSKWGRFVLLRNLIVGWVSHSLQDRDRSEVIFHLIVESFLVVILAIGAFLLFSPSDRWGLFCALAGIFLVAHTLMFIADGQLHCYLHEAIGAMQNAGIDEALRYMSEVQQVYSRSDAVLAVLVYGSFCRRQFHRRSDLDIRVLRRPGIWCFVKVMVSTFRLRYLSVFRRLPTDLLVVDSLGFVRRQMRKDESPVVLFMRDGFDEVSEAGLDFEAFIANPSALLKQ